MAAEDAHDEGGSVRSTDAPKVSNLKTYARVVNLKLKNFLLDF
jgi:hypothetical protein